mgnify:CR=1 FL=1
MTPRHGEVALPDFCNLGVMLRVILLVNGMLWPGILILLGVSLLVSQSSRGRPDRAVGGMIWLVGLVVLMLQINKHGLIPENNRRLMCLSMFWHFLDVVWIGVFSFVYLMGVL